MMHKFTAVLVVDDHGKDGQPAGHVIPKYGDVWVVI